MRRKEPIRLVIADDHDLAREGLRDMLEDEPDIKVVGEAANGREALALCSRLEPDLVLMDVRMPDMDGLSTTKEIKQRLPKISVLMVTMHENPDYLLEALRAGAAGYILKDAHKHEVTSAVREVLSGGSPLDPELAVRLLRRLATESQKQERPVRGLGEQGGALTDPITTRELEVLELLKLGWTNPQIAQKLVISPRTVQRHVANITTKLGVSDRTQAVVRSFELGLLDFSV